MTCATRGLPSALNRLPVFSPQDAALLNRLHRRWQPWHSQGLTLSWQACAPQACQWFSLSWGQAPLRAGLPLAWLHSLGAMAGEGPLPAMVLEAALLPWLEALEAASGALIRVQPWATPMTAFTTLNLSLTPDAGAPLPLLLELSRDATQLLAQRLAGQPQAPADLDPLTVPAQVSVADISLTLAELRSLRPGDVLLLDVPATPTLHCAGRQAALRREGPALTLLTCLAVRNPPAMNATPSTLAPDATLDDLDLTLSCQLGRLELSLGALRSLGEGSVLTLANREDQVELVVNGRRLGHGQLVRVGDGLGVRVLSFASL